MESNPTDTSFKKEKLRESLFAMKLASRNDPGVKEQLKLITGRMEEYLGARDIIVEGVSNSKWKKMISDYGGFTDQELEVLIFSLKLPAP